MSTTEGARAEAERPAAPLNYFNYFTEIEDAFVRRRGKHLLLSPMDWALMDSWKQMGVPLHVVLRGIETAFDSYESRPRNRSVKSLYYCQEEVEAQFAEWLESQRGASATAEGEDEPGANETRGLPFPREVIAAHLADSREALSRAAVGRAERTGGDVLTEALARAASRLGELEADFNAAARPDAELLEGSLTDLEALLDRAIRSSLPPEALVAKRAEAEAQLRQYRGRMERTTYEQTLENLLAKTLREECRVPRLSLFYL
ncbi:MAG TPA: hypothetical protein VD968_06115 [Pyrinomonadaceae bacterium]|nr:hypothetical protein [Pyrinomonadaceae bacterium]